MAVTYGLMLAMWSPWTQWVGTTWPPWTAALVANGSTYAWDAGRTIVCAMTINRWTGICMPIRYKEVCCAPLSPPQIPLGHT
ncbi:unnamed protein product [Sphagnum balticum]